VKKGEEGEFGVLLHWVKHEEGKRGSKMFKDVSRGNRESGKVEEHLH